MAIANNTTIVEQLGDWAAGLGWGDLTNASRQALKARVLDSIGCAIGALSAEPIRFIRQLTADMGGNPLVTLLGGGKGTPDQAAFFNGAAVRYLDFNDSYLAKGETCHPSDNVAPILAAAEYAGASGRNFLVALAIAYQVQCRLSDIAPVRSRGFDHTVQGAYGAAAGAAHALGLNAGQIANAVAISGTSYNSLRVTRTGELSNWKGLAYPNTARGAVQSALLAKYGITGPREVFEGNKGFMDAIAGLFAIDWRKEDLERVTRTITKRYNAEIHSQSSIEGLLELRESSGLRPQEIARIKLATFDVAFNIIGGGEEGGKKQIRRKEEADHSLPYMLAAAYIDGQLMPEQYLPERILRSDVQELLQKVDVRPEQQYSDLFPDEMACRMEVEATDGRCFRIEKRDYHGFTTRPADWDTLMVKYRGLTRAIDCDLAERIAETISRLDQVQVADLTALLGQIKIKDGE
ncbi:MAG TPA: MmgE/PrpD family protein [Bacilli bacterium]